MARLLLYKIRGTKSFNFGVTMNKKLSALLFGALALTSTAAFANTITFSSLGDVTNQQTSWTPANNFNLLFPQFNPAFGVLQSATFTLTGTTFGSITATATSNTTLNSITVATTIFLYEPGGSVLIVSTNPSMTQNFGPGGYALSNGQSYTLNTPGYVSPSSPGTGTTLANSNTLAPSAFLIGTGSITAPLLANGNSGYSGGSNINTNAYSAASASGTVTYTYSTVPEPATLLLMGIGVLVMGFAATRRKA